MRNDFATKIDRVLNAIHNVNKNVEAFSGRLDEAEERIRNMLQLPLRAEKLKR